MIYSDPDSPLIVLLLVNVLLLIAGMFLETGAAIVIMAPNLTPVAISFGIDPVHFGIIILIPGLDILLFYFNSMDLIYLLIQYGRSEWVIKSD